MIQFFKKHGIRLAQWVFLFTITIFALKLILLILPKLTVLATFTICLGAALILSVAYILQVSRDALRVQDKLQEVFQEQEKIQPLIDTCIKMQQDAIQKILDLKNTLTLYDNADMRQMVNVLVACENATTKTAQSFEYISSLFNDVTLGEKVKQPPQQLTEQEILSTTILNEADRKAINEALINAELFKE